MIIGVDAGMLGVADDRLKVGVYRVAYNLLKQLAEIDRKNTYRVYSFIPVDEFGSRMQNVLLAPSKGYLRLRLPLELRLHPVDLFLGLGQAIPPLVSVPSIGFVYDLGFLFNPEAYGSSETKLRTQTENLAKRATHILAISHATKLDIIKEFNTHPSDITVVYPGVDGRFFVNRASLEHPRPYFLFVGSLNKAKDIPLLLEAFATFIQTTKNTVDLLLVGGEYWPDPKIEDAIARYKLEDRVVKSGHVVDDALPGYYRGATAFVTTGLHEGFCLPAVEAMASGTPVIAVSRGALPEIVGDGGLVVSADSHHIAEAMNRMMKKSLRTLISKQAVVRSKQFSWQSFARDTLALMNEYAHQAD